MTGTWSARDSEIQTLNGVKVLEINGEASFNPQHGSYALDNFTVQFDVYHNLMYENNTAYSGPFYQLCDSQNRSIILLGYFQIENNGETHCEECFENLMTYNHYYFPYSPSSDWSTWRLTGYIRQMTDDGLYWGNFTLQIDNETITSFRSDSIIPEGTVHSITNEEVKPIVYFNIYPLPQTGGMTIPTASNNHGIIYSLLSNKVTLAQNSQSIPTYVDNFLYGYADAVPTSQTSLSTPTPIPTPFPTSQGGENNVESTPTPTVPEFSSGTILLLLTVLVATAGLLVYHKKHKRKM